MQVEHKTEKGTICFQKVKDSHAHFELAKLADYDPDDYLYLIADESFTKLPPGKWQLIGLTSEVTDEQAKIMVEEVLPGRFENYSDKECLTAKFGSALPSFKSLMHNLQVYDVNPFGEEPFNSDMYYPASMSIMQKIRDEWQEAQSRTGKFIVLFKPN